MIELSLKFDVSLSELILVFVGFTASYGLTQYFASLVSSTHPHNDNDVLDNHYTEVLLQESQKVSSSKNGMLKTKLDLKIPICYNITTTMPQKLQLMF